MNVFLSKNIIPHYRSFCHTFFLKVLIFQGSKAILYVRSLSYYIDKDSKYVDILITIYTEPQVNPDARDYAPGKQKNLSYYQWKLGLLREPGFLENQGWEPGKDRTKFEWTQKKYEEILLQACKDIYGDTQGNAFYEFIMPMYYASFYTGGILEDSYFDEVPGAGVELTYYYSHKNEVKIKRFCTTKPEVRK